MKNLKIVKTTATDKFGDSCFGVAFLNSDQLIRHLCGIGENLADETAKFCGGIIDRVRAGDVEFPIEENPHTVKIADGSFFATLSTAMMDGGELFFTTRPLDAKTDADFICHIAKSAIDYLQNKDGNEFEKISDEQIPF